MMAALFGTGALAPTSKHWRLARDGDAIGYELYQRHYSAPRYRTQRQALFVGPGEKLVLISHDDQALFVWRRFIDASGQVGVNCSVFRNEGPTLSSLLIADAETFAWMRWPGERLYTYVNAGKVRSSNPGCCFKKAGWTTCGMTKGGLLVLERRPTPGPTAVERIRPLIESGAIRACTRSGKPMTEGDAAVLLEFHELLSNQPPKETS